MTLVKVSNLYGLVVRRACLKERGVTQNELLTAVEAVEPLDANDDLLSFGPHFGQEAADAIIGRLQNLGLHYVDDFFEFSADLPDWCYFKAGMPGG